MATLPSILPTFPAQLPAHSATGYGYETQAAFVRTTMDTGAARQRRRFLTVPTRIPVTWLFTQKQLALFEAFVKYDLMDGAAWFQMNVSTSLGMRMLKVRIIESSKPTLAVAQQSWNLAAVIETLNMPVMTEAEYRALLATG